MANLLVKRFRVADFTPLFELLGKIVVFLTPFAVVFADRMKTRHTKHPRRHR